MSCPRCQSSNTVKNGRTHYGKQRFKCLACGRQFVEAATRQPITKSTRDRIDKLLLERLSLAAIVRITGVSERWLQYYVKQKYYQTPKQVLVTKKQPGALTIQLDEMWSFVGSKDNKQWLWLAIDSTSREIVGVYIGDRSSQSAKQLWKSLPPVYRHPNSEFGIRNSEFQSVGACFPPLIENRQISDYGGGLKPSTIPNSEFRTPNCFGQGFP